MTPDRHPIDVPCTACGALEDCACTFQVSPKAPAASMIGELWFHDVRIETAKSLSCGEPSEVLR